MEYRKQQFQTYEEFSRQFPCDYSMPFARGGHGELYRGLDAETNDEVAIKRRLFSVGDEFLSLEKEFTNTQEVPTSRFIVRYLYYGRYATPFGTYEYLVMRYYRDGNLTSHRLPWHQLPDHLQRRFVEEFLRGLDHLHNHNIIHRDIKPENVLLVRYADSQTSAYRPVLADFGISKILTEYPEIARTLVQNSMRVGTVTYMAPEQLRAERITYSADLWSFGIILYEIITGRHMVPRQSFPEQQREAAYGFWRDVDDQHFPTDLDNVAEPYQRIIRACLVVDPKKRVQRATDLLDLLTQPADDPAVVSTPTPSVNGTATADHATPSVSGLPESLPAPNAPDSQLTQQLTELLDQPFSPKPEPVTPVAVVSAKTGPEPVPTKPKKSFFDRFRSKPVAAPAEAKTPAEPKLQPTPPVSPIPEPLRAVQPVAAERIQPEPTTPERVVAESTPLESVQAEPALKRSGLNVPPEEAELSPVQPVVADLVETAAAHSEAVAADAVLTEITPAEADFAAHEVSQSEPNSADAEPVDSIESGFAPSVENVAVETEADRPEPVAQESVGVELVSVAPVTDVVRTPAENVPERTERMDNESVSDQSNRVESFINEPVQDADTAPEAARPAAGMPNSAEPVDVALELTQLPAGATAEPAEVVEASAHSDEPIQSEVIERERIDDTLTGNAVTNSETVPNEPDAVAPSVESDAAPEPVILPEDESIQTETSQTGPETANPELAVAPVESNVAAPETQPQSATTASPEPVDGLVSVRSDEPVQAEPVQAEPASAQSVTARKETEADQPVPLEPASALPVAGGRPAVAPPPLTKRARGPKPVGRRSAKRPAGWRPLLKRGQTAAVQTVRSAYQYGQRLRQSERFNRLTDQFAPSHWVIRLVLAGIVFAVLTISNPSSGPGLHLAQTPTQGPVVSSRPSESYLAALRRFDAQRDGYQKTGRLDPYLWTFIHCNPAYEDSLQQSAIRRANVVLTTEEQLFPQYRGNLSGLKRLETKRLILNKISWESSSHDMDDTSCLPMRK